MTGGTVSTRGKVSSSRALTTLLAVLVLVLAGCGKTIEGTPSAAGADLGNEDFRSLLQECNAVSDDQIAQVVGGTLIDQGFIGAICRWDVTGASGAVKVTFDWFENGSLDTERKTNTDLGWTVTDISVSSRKAIQIQQPDDPASCGVTAGAPDAGVIGWWVQYRPGTSFDPCQAATKLMQLALNLSA